MADGATQLHDGLIQGVAKIRLAMMLESAIKGQLGRPHSPPARSRPTPAPASGPSTAHRLVSSVEGTATHLDSVRNRVDNAGTSAVAAAVTPAPADNAASDPRQTLIQELSHAAAGAGQIAEGARRAGAGGRGDPPGSGRPAHARPAC